MIKMVQNLCKRTWMALRKRVTAVPISRREREFMKKCHIDKRTLFEILLVLITFASFVFAGYEYFQTTRPHADFEEVRDKLSLVESKILDAESINDPETQESVEAAWALYGEAERAYIRGDYSQAKTLLEQAYGMVPFVAHMQGFPFLVLIPVALLFLIIGYFLGKRTIHLRWPHQNKPNNGNSGKLGGSQHPPSVYTKMFASITAIFLLAAFGSMLWFYALSPNYRSTAIFPIAGAAFLILISIRLTIADTFFYMKSPRIWQSLLSLEVLGQVGFAIAILYDTFVTYNSPVWGEALSIVFCLGVIWTGIRRYQQADSVTYSR